MTVRVGVVVFPGSNCDRDTVHALAGAGAEPIELWHEAGLAAGRRRGHPPGRIRVRRLPPGRGDRPVQPGHARRVRLRGGWRARARHLQRLPGPGRGRAGAGRAAPQPGPALPGPRRLDRRRAARHAVHARPDRQRAAAHADRPRRGLLLRGRRDARCAGARRPGAVPVRRRRRGSGRGGRPRRQPERLAAGHRRRHQRGRQRRRAHAPPGTGLGGDPGLRGRRGDRPLARRERDEGRRRATRHRGHRDDRGGASPWSRSIAGWASPTTSSTRSAIGSVAATRTTSSSRCSASCGASTARTRAPSRCCGRCRPRARASSPGRARTPGVISIGDGLAVAFKIESHNHPTAVEPYQGAATGVGGILRDIFTMGARPIAVLDALRFGDPGDARTRHLVDGVVRGVGGYGNCVGVPTVGGELVFDPTYAGNPLVNVMAIGLMEERLLTLAAAPGPGNLVVLFGSTTGRDGIGGASVLASATFTDDDPSKRPSVQVGDPFAEKLLIEASPRAHRARAGGGPPGPGRRRHHVRHVRDRRPGRDGHPRRPRRDPAARAGHGALRGHDLRVAGADVRRRPARSMGCRPRASASAGACRSRSSGGSPTTATSRSSRAGWTPAAGPDRGRARSRGCRPPP